MSATLTRVDDGKLPERHTYRIEGCDISPEWVERLRRRDLAFKARKRSDIPYCEFTVWYSGNQLSAYSGEVWPDAWPALFECCKGTAQTGSYVLLTAEGLRLVAAAERAWESRS